MNEIFVALISLSGTVILALIGYYGAKRYKIGPNQDKLISTLQGIVNAQDARIEQLEHETQEYKAVQDRQTTEIKELRNLTIQQALTIERLETELGARKGVRNVRKNIAHSTGGNTASTE